MRGAHVLGWALVLSLMAGGGVGAQSPVASPPAGPSSSGEPIPGAGGLPDLDAIFSPSEPPIDLVVIQDEAVRTSVALPPEGGTVEATARARSARG